MNSTFSQERQPQNIATTAPDKGRKLRVTYILGSLRDAGTERQALELIQHLDRKHFTPSLIMMEETNVDRARELVDKCFVLGIPHAGSSRWLSRSASLSKAALVTRKYLRALRTDVVHAFLPAPCILGGIAARLAGVPVIIGSRRSLLSQYRSRKLVGGWADTAAFHLAHFNLGNSRAVSNEMVDIGKCSQRRCGTIYNGVDLQRFRPDLPLTLRQQLGWTHNEVVFGMVANFRPCKRHRDFVEAAAIIARQHDNARFLLTGEDRGTKQDVSRQIAALSLTDRIELLHSTPHPEQVFAALDVYVCSSDAEGFSNVILEAMSCGKPVIATRVGGNEEAVKHEITGLLVAAGDPPSLAEGAARLLDNAALRKQFGAAGRLRVEQDFSIHTMVQAHQELYSRAYEERRGRVPLRSGSEHPVT